MTILEYMDGAPVRVEAPISSIPKTASIMEATATPSSWTTKTGDAAAGIGAALTPIASIVGSILGRKTDDISKYVDEGESPKKDYTMIYVIVGIVAVILLMMLLKKKK